jgi:hypothetical protein
VNPEGDQVVSDATGTAARVGYREGQVLSAPDLLDEQAYLISMRQRHATTSHRWGIVRGLVPSTAGVSLEVSPGLAVDGLGRYLIVTDTISADLSSLTADSVRIWLACSLDPVGGAPAGQNTRWAESTLLRLEPGTMIDPRQSGDTSTDWPVLLGMLERSSANPSYQVNVNVRPLIGLCGETITAASGAAQVRVGPDFAVGLPAAPPAKGFTNKLRIDTAGNLAITANSQFHGDLVLDSDATLATSGRVGLGFGAVDPPQSASPWTIYRTTVEQKTGPPEKQMIVQLHQLNIELPPVDDNNPAGISAAIGREADGKFQSCLTVSPSGDVTITGKLRVQGLVYEGPIAADPSDPRFVVNLANAAAGNSADAGLGPLAVEVGGPDKSKVGDVPYTLAFTNNGTALVRVVEVQEIITLDNKLIAPTAEPIKLPFSLYPGVIKPLNRNVNLSQAGRLAIGVRVVGAAPDGSPLNAKDAILIQVTE